MNRKLYKLMNWPEIESIVYSESDNPHGILGPHVSGSQTLFQVFLPGAVNVRLEQKTGDKSYRMEMADESGFFAVLVPGKEPGNYRYVAEFPDGSILSFSDPYRYSPQISKKDLAAFSAGSCPDPYRFMGAHVMTLGGEKGTYFTIWAPNALRVSVIGDFNRWDGRINQMRRLGSSGIFEIFIPGVSEGDSYKYEIKKKDKNIALKTDPYGFGMEERPGLASVVRDVDSFEWDDDKWMKAREKADVRSMPLSVCEYLVSGEGSHDEEEDLPNWRMMAGRLIPFIKDSGFTHVEILPVMEQSGERSRGNETVGFYAPAARYGTPDDLQYFVNEMHKAGIGVILGWSVSQFSADDHGLEKFDGTSLYEPMDPRREFLPGTGTKLFDHGKNQVREFLSGNAFYWLEKYHIDGICADSVAVMLYLDYGKSGGDWAPNIYGGNENLDAVSFIRELNDQVHEEFAGAFMIAEEGAAWPGVTEDTSLDGLGYDFKWNADWISGTMDYLKEDPLFRAGVHDRLMEGFSYSFRERYMIGYSHTDAVESDYGFERQLFGTDELYLSSVRVFLAWMFAHPGRKLVFLGNGTTFMNDPDENNYPGWNVENGSDQKKLRALLKALLKLYRSEDALHVADDDESGFEWINCLNPERSVYSFMRKTENENDTVVVVVNFAGSVQEVELGVPYDGRYNLLLDTDMKKFGGTGTAREKSVRARSAEVDGRPFSIDILMGPQSAVFLRYTPYDDQERSEIALEKAEEERAASAAARKEAKKYKGEQDEAMRQAEEAMQNLEEAQKNAADAERKLIDARNREKILRERGEREISLARRKIEEARISAERIERNVNDRNASAAEQVRAAEELLNEARARIEEEDRNLKEAGEATENASRSREEAVRKASEADARMKQFQEIAGRAVKAAESVGRKARDTADAVGRKARDTADAVGRKARDTADNVTRKVSRGSGKKASGDTGKNSGR